MTCTRWPRARKASTQRCSVRATPLTSGGNVSVTRIRRSGVDGGMAGFPGAISVELSGKIVRESVH